jgi:hypothetical protein
MAPHAEINPQDITERARRDLLQLLEGVRKATWTLRIRPNTSPAHTHCAGSWQEESCD